MQNLPQIKPGQAGNSDVINSTTPLPNSSNPSPQTERLVQAKLAAGRLFELTLPPDVGDPKGLMTGAVAIFSNYPPEVMIAAVDPVGGIPSRSDRPTLKLIKDVCEEIYGPIRRNLEYVARQREREKNQLLLPRPPRTPEEQARIDKSVAEARAIFGVPGQSEEERARKAERDALIEEANRRFYLRCCAGEGEI